MAIRAKKVKPGTPGAGKGGVVPPEECRYGPGDVGNPIGRPSAGAAIKEWWNVMQAWPLPKIKQASEDEGAPVNKRAAAVQWLAAATTGDDPLDRILEHTAGKAAQTNKIEVEEKQQPMTEARMVERFLKYGVPEDRWPPMTLARFKNGRLKGQE